MVIKMTHNRANIVSFSPRYGSPLMIYHLANYTLDAMLHLSLNEFTKPEREFKLGVMVG